MGDRLSNRNGVRRAARDIEPKTPGFELRDARVLKGEHAEIDIYVPLVDR